MCIFGKCIRFSFLISSRFFFLFLVTFFAVFFFFDSFFFFGGGGGGLQPFSNHLKSVYPDKCFMVLAEVHTR